MPNSPARDGEPSDESLPDVCVITHPLAAAGENATRSLLDIIGAITGVVLVTADLPDDSEIRDRFPFVELTEKGAGSSIPVAAVRFVLNQFRMCAALMDREEQVVLFYGATSYVLPIAFARLLGKRVLVQPRGDVPLTLKLNWEQRIPSPLARGLAGIVRLFERIGFALANGVVTYTPGMAEQLGLDPSNPAVYPTGARYVRTDEFDVEIPYGERDRVVGFVGRLDEEKGIRELAAAVQGLPDDVTFRFIGDGNLREWLEKELAEEINAGNVEITGWVDHADVSDQLNDLKLLVLPSRPTEGLPTTVLEALACGTPVYATPVAGVPDVVQDEQTGFLMETTAPSTLSDNIYSILVRDDLPDVSVAGRRLVEDTYSFSAATERYRAVLCEFVE